MRTTLDIEDDIYVHARQVAAVEHVSVGKVVSRLMRQGLQNALAHSAGAAAADSLGFVYKHGIPVLPADGRAITQALIDRIRDEEGI